MNTLTTAKYYEDPQAIGSCEFHRFSPFARDLIATDGVVVMCETLRCFWFLDIIASYYGRLKRSADDSTMWIAVFIRNDDGGGMFRIVDDIPAHKHLVRQKVEYTDIRQDVKVYLCANELGGWTILLPSEY